MIAVEVVEESRAHYLPEQVFRKSQPSYSSTNPHQIKRFFSGDIMFISGKRNEVSPLGYLQSSTVIISPLGRRISRENPTFLKDMLAGKWPQLTEKLDSFNNPKCQILISSGSTVRLTSVSLDGEGQLLAVKYHDEGHECYPHYDTDGVYPDRISGIDNFLSLRAIDLYAQNVFVPEPVIATRRLFVALFVEGVSVEHIPRWVKRQTTLALNKAYEFGWLQKPDKLFGLIPRKYKVDLETSGNVKIADGKYFVIDPII